MSLEIKRLFVCLITETSHGLASDGQVVLIDFSLTVKAATLIFIFGCGLTISSVRFDL